MRAEEPQGPILTRLRRSVAAELVIAGGVLVVSALLVVSDPHLPASVAAGASAAHPSAGAAGGTVTLPTGPIVSVQADPATAGSPTITITTVSPSGATIDPVEVDATAALPARGIEPIPLQLTRTAAGHYVVSGVGAVNVTLS
jgi:copper transport protein